MLSNFTEKEQELISKYKNLCEEEGFLYLCNEIKSLLDDENILKINHSEIDKFLAISSVKRWKKEKKDLAVSILYENFIYGQRKAAIELKEILE